MLTYICQIWHTKQNDKMSGNCRSLQNKYRRFDLNVVENKTDAVQKLPGL